MCPSTTKYFSPLLSYMCLLKRQVTGCGTEPVITGSVPQHAASKIRNCIFPAVRARSPRCRVCGPRFGRPSFPGSAEKLRPGDQLESEGLGRVLGVRDHDRPVVLVD